MKRLVTLTAGVAFLLSTGCAHDDWSVQKALGLDARNPTPGTKNAPTISPADLKVAERVEQVGRKILAQNTFSGLDSDDTLFQTAGVKESVLFHDGAAVVISQGLAEKCQSDAELSAVLCAELGQMLNEKRNAKAVGRAPVDPIPDSSFGGSTLFPGGTAEDAGRQVEMRLHEKQFPRTANNTADAMASARELLKGAGYSPAELDRVEGLLKESRQTDRGEKLKKQMAGAAPPPTWQK
jgi:hypothetical protein